MQNSTQVPALTLLHRKLREGHKLHGDTPPWGSHDVQIEKDGVTEFASKFHWLNAMIELDTKLGGRGKLISAHGRSGLFEAIELIDKSFNRTRSPFRAWFEGDKITFERLAWENSEGDIRRYKWVGTGDDIWQALQNAVQAESVPITPSY